MERFLNGFLDLMTIAFMSRFSRKPMHLFGALGVGMFSFSAGIFIIIISSKLFYMMQDLGESARNITEISAFYVALTGMIIGVQLFLAGFLAEMTSKNDPSRSSYKVEEVR